MSDLNSDVLESDIGMYTNLHGHSIYSVLDGFSKVEDYVLRCKAMGMKGVCLTDHGNVFCHYDLWNTCKKHGMKPIFANEMYIAPSSGLVKEKIEGEKPAAHIILIAYNDIGYKNLIKLTSDSWTKFKYYKARTDIEQLAKYSEGLICTSACLGGVINQKFMSGRLEEAEDWAKKFKSIFGANYYLELIYTGMDKEQIPANNFLKELSVKLDIPLIITVDSHYTYKHESEFHRALVSINTGSSFKKKREVKDGELTDSNKDTDESSMFYTKEHYYLKPYHVLAEHFNDSYDAEAFANTNKIAEMCNVNYAIGNPAYPQPSKSPIIELRTKSLSFIDNYVLVHNFDSIKKQQYVDRLEYELDIINKMDFGNYFLVVEDYVNYAINSGMLVGPGRGSGAGSLVTFCLNITRVDPIKYNLLFDRMLNRGRSKLPLVELPGYPLNQYKDKRRDNLPPN